MRLNGWNRLWYSNCCVFFQNWLVIESNNYRGYSELTFPSRQALTIPLKASSGFGASDARTNLTCTISTQCLRNFIIVSLIILDGSVIFPVLTWRSRRCEIPVPTNTDKTHKRTNNHYYGNREGVYGSKPENLRIGLHACWVLINIADPLIGSTT